jgi:hypothetical protein
LPNFVVDVDIHNIDPWPLSVSLADTHLLLPIGKDLREINHETKNLANNKKYKTCILAKVYGGRNLLLLHSYFVQMSKLDVVGAGSTAEFTYLNTRKLQAAQHFQFDRLSTKKFEKIARGGFDFVTIKWKLPVFF